MTLSNEDLHSIIRSREVFHHNNPLMTFSLSRNLSGMKFAHCLPKQNKLELLATLTNYFSSMEGFFSLPLASLPVWQRECLLEHFLFPTNLQGNPESEALIVHSSGDILIVVNLKDHIVIHGIDFHHEAEALLNRLIQLDSDLNKNFAFSFSPEFGFLTADPMQCGTALHVQCFLHTPALIHFDSLQEIIDPQADIVLQIAPIGNLTTLTNRRTIGVTEEQILSSMRIWASKILSAEHTARTNLQQTNPPDVKNKVLRALGLLSHSCKLELKEALEALSWVHLGIELQWIKGETQQLWKAPFSQAKRGHLSLLQDQKNLEQEYLLQLRAQILKNLVLQLNPNF